MIYDDGGEVIYYSNDGRYNIIISLAFVWCMYRLVLLHNHNNSNIIKRWHKGLIFQFISPFSRFLIDYCSLHFKISSHFFATLIWDELDEFGSNLTRNN